MTTQYDGPIIDAHVHFWEPQHNHHPWLAPEAHIPFRYGDYSALKRPYLPLDYLQDADGHDVQQTVYIETEWDPQDPIGEVRYATALADQYGWPNAMIAQAWLHHDDVAHKLSALAGFQLVRGVRHKPGGATSPEARAAGQRTLLTNDQWRADYALLTQHQFLFELQTPWWNLPDALTLAEDFPSVQIILDHAALPANRHPSALRAWRDAIAHVAQAPNVAMKVSGIGDPHHAWTAEYNAWIVRESIAVFGPDRIMFASNFPVDSLCGNFEAIFGGFKQITAHLDEHHQRMLFHDNARRYYRLAESIPDNCHRLTHH